MTLTTERQGDVLIVAVSGRIDAAGGEAIREAIGETDRAAILNLEGLAPYGKQRGCAAHSSCIRQGTSPIGMPGWSSARCPPPSGRVFGITGFERLLPIHETRADALAALAGCRGGPQAP